MWTKPHQENDNTGQRSVGDAIRQLRQQLADYPRYDYLYNEAATRNVIINPMVAALGWDLRNLDQCRYENDPKDELWGNRELAEITACAARASTSHRGALEIPYHARTAHRTV